GSVQIQQAATWPEGQSPNVEDAEEQGRLLQERLKQAGIAGGPTVGCIGRDRLILREVRYPKVPPAEEPQVVRFQAAKELTLAAEDVVIDYLALGPTGTGSEQRALVLILPRDLKLAYMKLCRTAGLRLTALVPRFLGVANCLKVVAGTTVVTPAPA